MPENSKRRAANSIISFILTVAIGILLNILGSKLNGLLGLSLYLDCIGTILSAVTGGYLPCISVGFLTNVILGFSDSFTIYYCIISVLIAIAAVYSTRKKLLTRFPHVILPIIIFAFIGGVAGGLLTWMINGMSFGEGYAVDFAANINSNVPVGYLLSNLISCFLIDIVDKAIATLIALGIYYILPKKLTGYLASQSWHMIYEADYKRKNLIKKISLRTKSAMLVSASVILLASAAIIICILQYYGSTVNTYEETGNNINAITAEMLMDEEKVESFIVEGENAEGYAEMTDTMQKIIQTSPETKFIYVYRVTADGCIVVFDMDVPGIEGDKPGDLLEYDATVAKYIDLFLAGEDIPSDITNDEYGWLLSVYRPVYSESGKLLCYAITDMSMTRLRSDAAAFLTKLSSLFIGFLVLICSFALWAAQRYIVKPVNRIADAANRFSYDNREARAESMKMVESLDIDTGDEIENLYNAYKRTTADMMKYIDDVQHKSNQITNLQNGLILVLADMVENRDQCTGDHVKKTAAYVAIILEQLKTDGIYSDILTDEYIYDVVHSAPLHDVGKIKISDTILNKPGKLTDEEFKTMQTHTSSGSDIIDMVIDTVAEKSDYLYEARNLAKYHHEKWNGTGYPNGLSGEDIPLSARVMAVADVFDALVSRRSYKEPFSVEQALDIIRDGSGSHFDPQVVNAFLNAEEEVRKVAEMNMSDYDYKQHNL